jgi:hypothetical protein
MCQCRTMNIALDVEMAWVDSVVIVVSSLLLTTAKLARTHQRIVIYIWQCVCNRLHVDTISQKRVASHKG